MILGDVASVFEVQSASMLEDGDTISEKLATSPTTQEQHQHHQLTSRKCKINEN
jgi:hypothetical protein